MKGPYLLFDIGGTKTRLAVSTDGNSFNDTMIYKTPQKFDEGIDQLFLQTQAISRRIGIIVGGIAGPLNDNKTKIENAPNLPDWNGKPLKESLEEKFRAKVFLENDVALVGLGEAAHGAGKNFEIVAYITVSTGVNGVKIENKQIDQTSRGFEIGDQIVEDGKTLESIISGAAIEKKYGKKLIEVKDPKIWRMIEKYLAVGVHNTIDYWSPEVVILGGAITNDISIENITRNLKKLPSKFDRLPKIVKAELGDIGGLWGALYYLRNLG